MPTFDLDLVPGLRTTRTIVMDALGGNKYGGIEPADESALVFVYSDPAAGEEFGYTFDGQAEDDECGPLYYYTGEGPSGRQEFTDGNKSLLRHAEDGRTVHLFVADGYWHNPVTGRKTGARQQRYIGQMVVDSVQSHDRRQAPGRDGQMRSVIVFHLRPDPAAVHPVAFTPADAIPPAPQNQELQIDFDIPELDPDAELEPAAPVAPSAAQVETEAHNTDETVANIPGGVRTVVRWESTLTHAYKAHLVAAGHTVTRFQIMVEGVRGALKTDLYDATDNVLYEAKGTIRRDDIRMAIGQLRDYRRHVTTPPNLRLAVLLPGDPGKDLRDLLVAENIALVTRTADGFDGFPLPDPQG
jgi:5-methylcytosine-specific restriction protein A